MERKKIGRPSKGERFYLRAMLPVPQVEALKQEAAHRGMTLTDFLGVITEEVTGVPYTDQEGLPLRKSA